MSFTRILLPAYFKRYWACKKIYILKFKILNKHTFNIKDPSGNRKKIFILEK